MFLQCPFPSPLLLYRPLFPPPFFLFSIFPVFFCSSFAPCHFCALLADHVVTFLCLFAFSSSPSFTSSRTSSEKNRPPGMESLASCHYDIRQMKTRKRELKLHSSDRKQAMPVIAWNRNPTFRLPKRWQRLAMSSLG